jgi:hypothetical protein
MRVAEHQLSVIQSVAKNPEGLRCLIKNWILRYALNDGGGLNHNSETSHGLLLILNPLAAPSA